MSLAGDRALSLVRYFQVITFLCVLLLLSPTAYAQVAINSEPSGAGAAGSIVINFNGRFNGETIYEQYLNCCKVRFLTNGFYPVRADYGNYGNVPPSIATDPGDQQELILDFVTPVKDFEFWILAIDNSIGYIGFVDVTFNNGSVSNGHPIYANGGRNNIPSHGDGLKDLTNIKRIRIYGISDAEGLAFDDFSFTPMTSVDKVDITNPRVGLLPNGSTQNALVGADVVLQTSVTPSNATGGTYSWTFTGPHALVGGAANSSSVTIRSTDLGTITARVNYSFGGTTVSSTVNINTVLPSLSSFTANQSSDRIIFQECHANFPVIAPTYILGCPASPYGITFQSTSQIPGVAYLSDPAQSGIKYVQVVSSLRKRLLAQRIECKTGRSSESNVASGWQLDTQDPFNDQRFPVRRFSEGNTLTMEAEDSPSEGLYTGIAYTARADALYVDDHFEMYVVYFTGSTPGNPIYQRTIGLTSFPNTVARIAWRWGGQVVFDPYATHQYRIQFSNVNPTTYTAGVTSARQPFSGNVSLLTYAQCPGGPTVAVNDIDGTRFFVRQHYRDFLGREEPDQAGWDHWTGNITHCGFNISCLDQWRIHTSRAFFFAPDFIQNNPLLAESNRGTPSYNREFVRWCYLGYLGRPPDQLGWDFWTGELNRDNNYDHIIRAFLVSPEYRGRFGPVSPNPWP